MDNIKTGLADLDKLLDGGFPEKTALLLSGEAGCGKTLFALNFLVQGAKFGDKCCYVSLGETKPELIRACSGIASLKEAEKYTDKNLIFKHIKMDETHTLEEFMHIMSQYPNLDRLVIDNVNQLLMHAENSRTYRMKFSELVKMLKDKASCTLLLCETKGAETDSGNGESFEADGVVKLGFQELEEKPRRTLQIMKMRYTGFDPRVMHEFVVGSDKIRLTRAKII